ncbi:MAG TPA: hypothetical protein VMT20_12660 [Terriglobia bacterium]|nr:hypothetical protein [Terriglobia bacterium]
MPKLVGSMLYCLLLALAPLGGGPKPQSGVREVSLTRVVRMPVVMLNTQGSSGPANQAPGALTLSPGATDELPEGPDGFDVLDDGTLLITDPLRDRLAVYDSQGAFKREWKLGFPADSVTAIPNGLVLIRDATTGELHAFDREGQPKPAATAVLPEREQARLLTAKSGVVGRPATAGGPGGPLQVQFDRAGLRLLSLEGLATDGAGNTYVALETTAGGETIDVNKYVRRYNAHGELVAEISDMKVDYYVRPVDELRVHKGVVYQLMSTRSEVRVNVWDTN